MGSTRALLLAGVVALGAAAAAHAADLPLPPPPPEYVPVPEPTFGGWYLRGDVGAGLSTGPDIRSSFFDIATNASRSLADLDALGQMKSWGRDRQTIGDTGFVDVGVGYQFNNWLRFDVTGEVRSDAKFSTTEHYDVSFYNAGALPGQFGHDVYNGSVQSSLFLANAYVDLGTWYGLTPYLGGGIGAAYNHMAALTDTNPGSTVLFADGTSQVQGLGGGGFAAAGSKWNLAYAAMAGVSYDITHNLKLDIGYRYLNMGSITSGRINCLGGTPACGAGNGFYEKQRIGLASNDIRVGLRWLINDYAPAPVLLPAPEQPIIRKY